MVQVWLPNWRNEDEYPDPENTSSQQWAWEFLRRSPGYQKDYFEFENNIEAEILQDAQKKDLIGLGEVFVSHLHKEGKDAFVNTTIPEKGNWLLAVPIADGGHLSEKGKKLLSATRGMLSLPLIFKEPPSVKRLRDFYFIKTPQNPARRYHQAIFDFVPYSPPICHFASLREFENVRPENDNEFTAKIDLTKSIDKQLQYVKDFWQELNEHQPAKRVSTKALEKLHEKLRILDAYSCKHGIIKDIKHNLAEMFDCSVSNIEKHHLSAKILRDGGYRKLAQMDNLSKSCQQNALNAKFQLTVSKLLLQRE